ncbi:MAG: hypothetical protein GOV15_04045, partial [Candidatus Diapherotrites archaeon]|nr:hypothetical protein [Candidatus Diapherotrites archaeon]
MICFIAMLVFGVLGVFSAKHRPYAKEAFDCVFRRMTLRPCNTSFDRKMRAKIVGRILPHSKPTAKFVGRYFEFITWGFTLMFLGSFVLSAQSVYNYAAFGDCNGPHSDGEGCFLNELNPSSAGSCGSDFCAENGCECDNLEIGCEHPDYKACD